MLVSLIETTKTMNKQLYANKISSGRVLKYNRRNAETLWSTETQDGFIHKYRKHFTWVILASICHSAAPSGITTVQPSPMEAKEAGGPQHSSSPPYKTTAFIMEEHVIFTDTRPNWKSCLESMLLCPPPYITSGREQTLQ